MSVTARMPWLRGHGYDTVLYIDVRQDVVCTMFDRMAGDAVCVELKPHHSSALNLSMCQGFGFSC